MRTLSPQDASTLRLHKRGGDFDANQMSGKKHIKALSKLAARLRSSVSGQDKPGSMNPRKA